jgi:hypothetical protein
MINLGASSDNFMMKAETDFGPRVSFELNSLFPSSLIHVSGKNSASEVMEVIYLRISSESWG